MTQNYKTGNLPQNFVILGYILFAISIWRIIMTDYLIGIVVLIVSIFLIFLKSGISIDTENKKLKRYNGIFILKKGEWQYISTAKEILIHSFKQSQNLNVLSISTTQTNLVYKFLLNLEEKKIELMSGQEKKIDKLAKKISETLNIPIKKCVTN